ncbi:MAG TPA: carboxypeptidase regulatory-like domain-containing protein [Vicinamibacterales bacterium]|nr:carboxypeptidase regulatory-like domain-containing protein [Vicinamibacterales bacterium]
MRANTLLIVGCLMLWAGQAVAQSTSGTISGRVSDSQGLPLPGVTVSATSPNMQGTRETVTSENGDYILTLLPAGMYRVVFSIAGFQSQERSVGLAPTQTLPLQIELRPGLTEKIVVEGRTADVLTQTSQVATNFDQTLMSTLPTQRDYRSVMLMAPGAHPSGPSGSFSVAGSMSFENLYMVNGVSVNENLRGQAQDLVIEDALQETTVATAGVSAEFGRFGGGVINMVTKSGGNRFSGSYRDTLTNDDWRALVPKREGDPFANDTKLDDVVPSHEYTIGGPVMRDRVWFFTAGRLQTNSINRQLVITNIPYVFTDKSRRYEGKLTYLLDPNHRVQGAFTKINRDQTNDTFNTTTSMDVKSLYNRSLPEDLYTFSYTGVITPKLFVEGRYSHRDLTFVGSGSQFTDIQKGTLLVDLAGRRYNSPTFCGVCTDEERDNQDVFVKGSYFLSTKGSGSHNVSVGFDSFNDRRLANNFQSGSNYRLINAPAILNGSDLIATFISGTTQFQWNPIFIESLGTKFRTYSVFANDNWHMTDRITANLGLRWDRNDGVDSNGVLVADTSAFSPRLGVVWDPVGDQKWSVTGSVAKYVAGLLNSIADQTSPAGNSDQYNFVYTGPSINTDPATRVSNEQAVQQMFDWFNANGGATLPLTGSPSVRGVSPQVRESLDSPYVWEYGAGVNRQFGSRAAVRADFMYRDYGGFYTQRTDITTGQAIDTRSFAPASVSGRAYDLTLITNDNDGLLNRQYAGLSLQAQYRAGTRFDFGGNYTISRAWGNFEGETVPNGPISAGANGREAVLNYPEYRGTWNYPEGDLSIDQRHRARLWLNVSPGVSGLTLSVLQALESGVPYSASNQNGSFVNGVDPRPYVTNPGYLNPPDGANTQYFFTARDGFRLEGQKRTDFAAMYDYGIPTGGGNKLDMFIAAQVINLFNQFQLCGCGGSAAFALGGNIQNQTVDTAVRTNVTNPTLYQPFNPFTTTPVEGVNWAKSPTFGKALNRFAYTTPRTFRLTFGVRF